MPMRAFVTGGTGFVGSNLVAALTSRGVDVQVLRRPGSALSALDGLLHKQYVGDVLGDVDDLARAMDGCAWVFHAAGVADYWRYRGTTHVYGTNVAGTRNVLVAARLAGIERLVFTSSIAALGRPAPGELLDESSEFNLRPGEFPYGHSKRLAEREVQNAVAAGLPAVIVNPGVVIGARDVHHGTGALVLEAARGRLRAAPPGGVNFVAAQDVARGHIAAAELGRIGDRYVLAGENLTYLDAFATICEVVGRPPPSVVLPRWTMPVAAALAAGISILAGPRLPVNATQLRLSMARIFVDGRRARADFGLSSTPFETAVEQAYDWYVKQQVLGRGPRHHAQ